MAAKHICPTCELEQPATREVEYFARSRKTLPPVDGVGVLYEDAHKVLQFLGALAEASPRAVAHAMENGGSEDEEWVMWLAWLAEELTEEAERRLLRLRKAGLLWEERVLNLEKTTAEKRVMSLIC